MDATLSVPQQYSPSQRNSETAEDCRDYLRTGRCKYGASCKYNHPPNVQSGGGMKAPIDPSEPMFPIRPNEPVCQYYMKHGTCKFGQACKFHHPPQGPVHATVNGGPVLMNVARKNDARLVLNPVGTDTGTGSVMLQFLPQRPDEPDCIYFLKNGRCKYGATCRYHHPMNFHQRRSDEVKRQPTMQEFHQPRKLHYVAAPGYAQGHVILAENPGAFVTVENGAPLAFQPVAIITNGEGIMSYGAPIASTLPTEQGSSGSSISSSYDTAGSNFEHFAYNGDTASLLWARARRNGSGNSLNAYMSGDSSHNRFQNRAVFPHSASDGNIARRNRTASYGSASDPNQYDGEKVAMTRNAQGSSWRHDRSVVYEAVRFAPAGQYSSRQESVEIGSEMRAGQARGRPPVTGNSQLRRSPRRNHRARESDEGFTMMTSALLTMLDTQEEASAESVSDDDLRRPQACYEVDSSMFESLSLNPGQNIAIQVNRPPEEDGYWSPSWRGSSDQYDRVPPNFPGLPPRHQSQPRSSTPNDSDVGLYLP